MDEREQKDNSSFWLEEESELAELEPEEKKSSWRRVVTALVIALILLLLFWPVDKSKLKLPKRNASNLKRQQAGRADYQILAATPLYTASEAKTFPVKVTFKVKNLGTKPEQLSFSMVSLQDENGVTYEPASSFTVDWYEKSEQKNPWDEMVEPKESVKVVVFFNVFKGPEKKFFLVGRDFDWTTQEARNITAGAF